MLCCRYLLLTPPHLAGTEEHHLKTGMQPGTGMGHTSTGMGGLGDTGMGHHTGMGHTGTGMGTTGVGHTGLGDTGMGHTGTGMGHHTGAGMGTMGTGAGLGTMGATGAGHHTGMGHTTGTGMGTTDTGYTEEGKETMGHKIKKMIPGGALRDERWWGRVG